MSEGPPGFVPWAQFAAALERVRALEEKLTDADKRAAEEKEYSKAAGAKVNGLEEWRRLKELEAARAQGREEVLDQVARDNAATAERKADSADQKATRADKRAKVATGGGALVLLYQLIQGIIQLVNHLGGGG